MVKSSRQWAKGIERLLKVNLGLIPDDRLLILTDLPPGKAPSEWKERIELAELGHEVANRLGISTDFVSFPAPASHGQEPPREVWETAFGSEAIADLENHRKLEPLLNKTLDDAAVEALSLSPMYTAVLALTEFSTSHTRFRRLMTKGNTRYASCPLFDPAMLLGSMDVDWEKMAAVTRVLADKLSSARMADIICPRGTRLEMSLENRPGVADTGLLTTPGAFGNLPAGEAYTAPVEDSIHGRLVITHSPTTRLKSPLGVIIENGKAVGIEGDDPFKDVLEEIFFRHPANSQVAELGIGTNPKAANPLNILEAEKIAGTIHIAFGDNQGFGGKNNAPFHEDFVVFNPELSLDGLKIPLTTPVRRRP